MEEARVFSKTGHKFTKDDWKGFFFGLFVGCIYSVLAMHTPWRPGIIGILLKSIIVFVAFLFFYFSLSILMRDHILRIVSVRGKYVRVFTRYSLRSLRWFKFSSLGRLEYEVEFHDLITENFQMKTGSFSGAEKYLKAYNKKGELIFSITDNQLSGLEIISLKEKADEFGVPFEITSRRILCRVVKTIKGSL